MNRYHISLARTGLYQISDSQQGTNGFYDIDGNYKTGDLRLTALTAFSILKVGMTPARLSPLDFALDHALAELAF